MLAAIVLVGAAAGVPLEAAAQTTPQGSDETAPSATETNLGLTPTGPAAPGVAGAGLPGFFSGLRSSAGFGPPPPPQPGQPAIQFTPAITGAEVFDSNIDQTQRNQRWDLITEISPSITIQGQEPRATINLAYSPTAEIYARTSSADGVNQNLATSSLLTLVPNTLYVQINGFAAVLPTNGGLGSLGSIGATSPGAPLPVQGLLGTQGQSALIGNGNRTQSFAASIFPYFVHQFGSFGTASAGVNLTETLQHTTITNSSALLPGTAVGSQDSQTEEAVAQFETGDDFGRVRDLALADGARSQGTGVLSGAYSNLLTDWFGYALNREVLPFGELGYEDLRYNTVVPTRISDAVWQAGVQLAPNPESLITIGYGHRQGTTGLNVVGYYQVTARTRLTASYMTGLTTDLQQIQSTLGLTGFNSQGFAVNTATGAPLLLGNALLGTQNTLYTSKNLVMTVTTMFTRDQLSAGVLHQSEVPVGSAPGAVGIGLQQSAVGVFGSWVHQLSEVTNLSASAGLQRNSYPSLQNATQSSVAVSVGLSRQLSEKLTGFARYLLYDVRSDVPGQTFVVNVALIGLTRTF